MFSEWDGSLENTVVDVGCLYIAMQNKGINQWRRSWNFLGQGMKCTWIKYISVLVLSA